MPFFPESTSRNVIFIPRYSYIRPLLMTRVQFWTNGLSLGSFEVIWDYIHFLPLTFDRIEIERWWWSQCVSLVQTHRLVCNMAYLARQVTSRELDHGSYSEIDLFRSILRRVSYILRMYILHAYCVHIAQIAYILRCVSASGTRCWQNYVTIFLSSKVICEKHFCKRRYFHLSWPL